MQYIKFACCWWLLVTALFLSVISQGFASNSLLQPFAVSNMNPFIGVYGIATMQSSVVTAAKQSSVNVTLDAASHFTDSRNLTESIRIDGESYRLAVRFSRGLTDQWEVGTEIPFVSHSGGFMDGFINRWHNTFGLPTLGRDRVANDRLVFRYSRNGDDLINVQASTSGLGDILFFTGKTLQQTDNFAFTTRAQLKLPSGDASRLLGSGGTDVSIAAMASRRWGEKWLGSIQLGGSLLQTGDILPELQRNWVGFAAAYLGWRPFPSLAIKLQLDVHTAVYRNSDMQQLTDEAYQLTIGGSAHVGRSTFLDVAVTEDEINPDVSSDVRFQLRLRTLY